MALIPMPLDEEIKKTPQLTPMPIEEEEKIFTPPQYEKKAFGTRHPNIYGLYGSAVAIAETLGKIGFVKYSDPNEVKKLLKMSPEKQKRQLMMDTLESVGMVGAEVLWKRLGMAAETYAPRLYKFLTKERGAKPIPKLIEKPLSEEKIPKKSIAEELPPKEEILREIEKEIAAEKGAFPKKEVMRLREFKEISQNLKEGIEKGKPFLTDPQRRIMYDVQETILEHPEHAARILSEYDITAEQLTDEILARASDSGRVLNQLSQIRKTLQKTFPKDKSVQSKLKSLQDAESWWNKPLDWWQTMDRWRRMSMVSQQATAMRNAISQAFYYSLRTGEDLVTGMLKTTSGIPPRKAFIDFTESLGAIIRRMSKPQRQKLNKLLDNYAGIKAELLSAPIHDITLGGKVSKVMMFFNRTQENLFRKMKFDAVATALAKKRGINLLTDPKTLSNQGRKQVIKILKEATDEALITTFAKKPDNQVARQAMYWWTRIPLLTTIQPFPRFWANSLKFLWDYNPTGFITTAQKLIMSQGGEKAAQAASKAILGTGMLGMALAIRESDWAGPKWYLIKRGGKTKEGKQKYIDLRAFAPFSSYLFLADVMRNFAGRQTSLSAYDVMQGIVGINRVAGTGLVLLDVMRSESIENASNMLQSFIGEYFGGFSVGARTIKDFVGIFNEKERKVGATRERPLIGPFMENLPTSVIERFGYKIPEAEKITEPGGYERKGGVFPGGETIGPAERQFTGITLTPKTPLEEEILRLNVRHIYPRTGDPELNRKILREINKPIEKRADILIKSKRYQEASDILKKNLIKQMISRVKKQRKVYTRIANQHYSEKIKEMSPENRLDFVKGLARKHKLSLSNIWKLVRKGGISLSTDDRKEIRDYYVR